MSTSGHLPASIRSTARRRLPHPMPRRPRRHTRRRTGLRSAPPSTTCSPEERAAAEEFARQIDAARQQLLDAPAGLGRRPTGAAVLRAGRAAPVPARAPLDDARVAIDALAAVVERLGSRLGEAEQPLRQALNQLQLAFVEVSGPRVGAAGEPAEGERPAVTRAARSRVASQRPEAPGDHAEPHAPARPPSCALPSAIAVQWNGSTLAVVGDDRAQPARARRTCSTTPVPDSKAAIGRPVSGRSWTAAAR